MEKGAFGLKSHIMPYDDEKREFVSIMTSEVVDSQKEIMNMDKVIELLPLIRKRGVSTHLGHFGVDVGDHIHNHEVKTFSQILDEYPDLPEDKRALLEKYDPNTRAIVSRGKIKKGSKFDDIAWDMLKTGKANGVSVGGVFEELPKIKCDATGKCGKVIQPDGVMFELVITGEGLDFPIQSFSPSNPTGIILALKSAQNNTNGERYMSTEVQDGYPPNEAEYDDSMLGAIKKIVSRLDAIEEMLKQPQTQENQDEGQSQAPSPDNQETKADNEDDESMASESETYNEGDDIDESDKKEPQSQETNDSGDSESDKEDTEDAKEDTETKSIESGDESKGTETKGDGGALESGDEAEGLSTKVSRMEKKIDMMMKSQKSQQSLSQTLEDDSDCNDCSSKTPNVKTKADGDESKSDSDAEDTTDGATTKTEDNIKMKSDKKDTFTKEEVEALISTSLETQRKELYEKLGIKTTQTPIGSVDSPQSKGGASDEGGKTMHEVVQHFSLQRGIPSINEMVGYLEAV